MEGVWACVRVQPIDLAHTYLHLEDGAGVRVLEVDENIWATIDQRTDLGDPTATR